MKIKEKLKNIEVKKIYMGITLFLLLVIVAIAIKGTHAFYNNTATIPFVNAKIGDFLNPTTGNIDRTSDINLIYYIESQEGSNNYILAAGPPGINYTLDTTASNCTPRKTTNLATYSNYSITEDGNVTVTVSENTPNQVVCRLFYKRNNLSDITMYMLEENDYGTIAYNNRKYSLTETIPTTTHKYNTYRCVNNGATITYSEDTGLNVTQTKPDTCYLYFNKK